MSLRGRCPSGRPSRVAGWILAVLLLSAQVSSAATIVLKDGRRLQGSIGKVAGLDDNPQNSQQGQPATITFVDDNLRRVFVPTFQVLRIEEIESGERSERIAVKQHVARAGSRVNRVGPIVEIEPFDRFGRRTFTMMTDKGPLGVVQGITQITPVWTKVEGLVTQMRTPLVWDMRIATSSIPRETLRQVLMNNTNPKNLDQRLRVVRLFLQSDRFKDAQAELEEVVKDFPEEQNLAKEVRALRQLHARSILREIEVRRKAGQHALAYTLLDKFPTEDVAGETLQQVREMLTNYQTSQKTLQEAHAELKAHIASLGDADRRRECEALLDEMAQELNINTMDRLSAYLQLRSDPSLGAEQKLSLAFSGWLLGSNSADANLIVMLSLARVREIVRQYLNEPVKIERERLLRQLNAQEGGSPSLIAKLIAHMKPPLATPEPSMAKPGFYKLDIPIGIDNEPDVTYYVQLPPQYDPHVRYPTIVTLNGAGTTPENQIDWWAGAPNDSNTRLGQATRLGYIVIAVDWLTEGQKEYGFTAREHAAVLGSLRDACRRFSIDTDRVFLSGHSMGGDAAWDIGLAHPDLWAGVIPIVAQTQKYCSLYWENATQLPFYVLLGEKDGDRLKENARDLNRYMTKRFDVTVVEYQGRGHEDFYEDIQNLFDWMGRRPSRDFFPKQFTVTTMRSWDNYFWWLEADKFPSRGIVEPANWPPARGVRPVQISARVLATNGLAITSAASGLTVWLSPEVVNFDQPMKITLNNTSITKTGRIDPDLGVLLEDVRTRADRLHPFWAKVEQ